MNIEKYVQDFIKCLNEIDQTKRNYDVFQDFLTCSAISLANVLLKDKNYEKKYLEVIKQYKQPEKLADLLGITALALEKKPCDFLGRVYMLGNFGNKNTGQFFTPYHISQLMAECTFDKNNIQKIINTQRYITVSDPCCGAGGMIIAFAETILKHGFNPQKQIIFQGIDIDITCCKMSYIQTSLLGLTGEIIHGDSLSLNLWQTFTTPMTILNLDRYRNFKQQIKSPETEKLNKITETIQLKLI